MLNQKTAARHDEANAAAAAHVLRNRASQPLVVVLVGRSLPAPRESRTNSHSGDHGHSRTTAPPA